MDPITLALASAAVAGIAKIGEKAIVDAYEALKALLKAKYGPAHKIVKAAEEVEANPASKTRPGTLNEEIVSAGADQDAELLKAAEELLAKLKSSPAGQTIVNQVISGNNNYVSGTGNLTVHNNPGK